MSLVIVSREEWGAEPLKNDLKLLSHPVKFVIISQLPISRCKTRKQCFERLKQMRTEHTEQGFPDIAYNFIIGGDGVVYEGLGWKFVGLQFFRRGKDISNKKIDIAYVGTYLGEYNAQPPAVMKNAVQDLIRLGVERNFIRKRYRDIETDPSIPDDEPMCKDWLESMHDF